VPTWLLCGPPRAAAGLAVASLKSGTRHRRQAAISGARMPIAAPPFGGILLGAAGGLQARSTAQWLTWDELFCFVLFACFVCFFWLRFFGFFLGEYPPAVLLKLSRRGAAKKQRDKKRRLKKRKKQEK
jgi:hypothetical protein